MRGDGRTEAELAAHDRRFLYAPSIIAKRAPQAGVEELDTAPQHDSAVCRVARVDYAKLRRKRGRA